MKKTGIIKSETDEAQPYRVWFNGEIVRFTKNIGDAHHYLNIEWEKYNESNQALPERKMVDKKLRSNGELVK